MARHKLFIKGGAPGPGRKKQTPLGRARGKLVKTFIEQEAESFKEACGNLLPLAMSRVRDVLEKKDKKLSGHHIRATEMLRDSVFGRPPQAITGAGGGPFVATFTQLLGEKVDGARHEKL